MIAGLMFLSFGFIATSCSGDDIVETEWDIQDYPVQASEWSWNPANRRWEVVKSLKYMDNYIYESGAVIGYVFLGEQNYDEVQTQLPYLKSFRLDDGSEFTETISYEYSSLTKRVTFYIQPSDGIQDTAAKAYYQFRLVLIW